MATSTYTPIATTTLASAASSYTFSSIPQTYTDLILVANFDGSASSYNTLTFNGVGGTSYSKTRVLGTGGYTVSNRSTSTSSIDGIMYNTAGTPITTILNVMNYSNTTTYKTVLIKDSNQPDNVAAHVGLFRGSTGSSTEAITSITLTKSTGNFTIGSTFSLYGISAAPSAKATGGMITSDATYYYHTFLNSGTFTPTAAISADVLVVAGGGGAGQYTGTPGGAGGLSWQSGRSLSSGTGYTCTVGAGGVGAVGVSNGTSGGNSVFDTITSYGGGYGVGGGAGAAGGSGGGGGFGGAAGGASTQTSNGGATGYGNAGGTGASGGSSYSTGGGGGAGGAGAVGTNGGPGVGGVGLSGTTIAALNAIGAATNTGQLVSSNYYYAGGGGGAWNLSSSGAAGGYGGGGTGGNSPTAGTTNTGGGGGGVNNYTGTTMNGANGGSGIVIVRYAK
jgi:hypothetical protein